MRRWVVVEEVGRAEKRVLMFEEGKRPAATLMMFCYDERPCLNLVRSIIRDARRWPELSVWDTAKDALISRSRSAGAEHFLEQGAGDVFLMVDHDIGWEAGDLEHLTAVCLDLKGVVGGVYPKRGFSQGVPIRFGKYGNYDIPDDRVVECESVATGFIAIHRSVLEAMAAELPMTMHGWHAFFATTVHERADGKHEYESEDYAFCRRARELGFQVFADLRPQLSHHGAYLYTVADTAWKPPVASGRTTVRAMDPSGLTTVQGVDARFELYVDPEDSLVSGALIRGEMWEPEVVTALRDAIRPDDVVVEVGAHIGYHAAQLATLAGRYVAIEPLPHQVDLLRKNLKVDGVAEIWPAAVVADDDYRKSVRMLRDYRNPGASFVLPREEEELGIEVAAVRLPDITDRIDVLKIDAEGSEYLILNGPRVREMLRSTRVIVTEFCEDQLRAVSGVTGAQYLALLEELGFDVDVDEGELPKGKAYCNLMMERKAAAVPA